MPKLAKPLTDIEIGSAKPKDKIYKLSDGGGMYIEIMPTGAKKWRMSYMQAKGKKNRLTLGTYSETSLVEVRDKRATARKQIADGTDPAVARDSAKLVSADRAATTFEKLARDWHANKRATWHETTAKDILRRLELNIFPQI
jgi:hypothetical protein